MLCFFPKVLAFPTGCGAGAADEAAKAQCWWLELLALRELLALGPAEALDARLRGVSARLAASEEELASALGE